MATLIWLLSSLAFMGALMQLVVAARTAAYHRGREAAAGTDRPPLSLLVPLKGAAPDLRERLDRALDATSSADHLVLALEGVDDPAHEACLALQRDHAHRDVEIVLAGPSGERMGKAHNLAAALRRARHDLIAAMDDDVELDRAVVDESSSLAQEPGAGGAFAFPSYGGRPTLGGALVAVYTNFAFMPNMASLALASPPRFIVGGYWAVTREALLAIGGFEAFTGTVSDDAAIGRALHATGRRNHALRRTVRLAPEPLGIGGGLRHVLKWLTLLRAEGALVFALIAFTWHPAALALPVIAMAAVVDQVPTWPLALLAASIVGRLAAWILLNSLVHAAGGPLRHVVLAIVYETVLAPVLFVLASVRREIVWRGKRYRVGPGGVIAGR